MHYCTYSPFCAYVDVEHEKTKRTLPSRVVYKLCTNLLFMLLCEKFSCKLGGLFGRQVGYLEGGWAVRRVGGLLGGWVSC